VDMLVYDSFMAQKGYDCVGKVFHRDLNPGNDNINNLTEFSEDLKFFICADCSVVKSREGFICLYGKRPLKYTGLSSNCVSCQEYSHILKKKKARERYYKHLQKPCVKNCPDCGMVEVFHKPSTVLCRECRNARARGYRAIRANQRRVEMQSWLKNRYSHSGSILYIMSYGRFKKIGISADPKRRFNELKGGRVCSPDLLEGDCLLIPDNNSAEDVERILHYEFMDFNVLMPYKNGVLSKEYFNVSDRLLYGRLLSLGEIIPFNLIYHI